MQKIARRGVFELDPRLETRTAKRGISGCGRACDAEVHVFIISFVVTIREQGRGFYCRMKCRTDLSLIVYMKMLNVMVLFALTI